MFDFKTAQNVKHITFKYTNTLNYKITKVQKLQM